MFAVVYKQSFDKPLAKLLAIPVEGCFTIPCPDCKGSGVFEITKEDSQPCVACKTSGEVWVSN